MDGVKKKLRNKIMSDIASKYRDQQKEETRYEKVNLFLIWEKYDISYSDFINVILSLEAKDYLKYEKANKSKERIFIKGEYVPQEFVVLKSNGKSFLEDLSDDKENEIKSNLKRPLQVQVLTILISILLSSGSICLLWQIIQWFLSLFRS